MNNRLLQKKVFSFIIAMIMSGFVYAQLPEDSPQPSASSESAPEIAPVVNPEESNMLELSSPPPTEATGESSSTSNPEAIQAPSQISRKLAANYKFGVTVTIDQPEYWTDLMPSLSPSDDRFPTMVMKLTVFNHSAIPATFNFTSSQRYDFEIYYEGERVWRWSENRSFLDVMGQITLVPGQSLVYKENFKLAKIEDGRKVPIPEGDYTLKGRLTAYPYAEGQVSFRHYYVW